jgi:hypothetical protein
MPILEVFRVGTSQEVFLKGVAPFERGSGEGGCVDCGRVVGGGFEGGGHCCRETGLKWIGFVGTDKIEFSMFLSSLWID